MKNHEGAKQLRASSSQLRRLAEQGRLTIDVLQV